MTKSNKLIAAGLTAVCLPFMGCGGGAPSGTVTQPSTTENASNSGNQNNGNGSSSGDTNDGNQGGGNTAAPLDNANQAARIARLFLFLAQDETDLATVGLNFHDLPVASANSDDGQADCPTSGNTVATRTGDLIALQVNSCRSDSSGDFSSSSEIYNNIVAAECTQEAGGNCLTGNVTWGSGGTALTERTTDTEDDETFNIATNWLGTATQSAAVQGPSQVTVTSTYNVKVDSTFNSTTFSYDTSDFIITANLNNSEATFDFDGVAAVESNLSNCAQGEITSSTSQSFSFDEDDLPLSGTLTLMNSQGQSAGIEFSNGVLQVTINNQQTNFSAAQFSALCGLD